MWPRLLGCHTILRRRFPRIPFSCQIGGPSTRTRPKSLLRKQRFRGSSNRKYLKQHLNLDVHQQGRPFSCPETSDIRLLRLVYAHVVNERPHHLQPQRQRSLISHRRSQQLQPWIRTPSEPSSKPRLKQRQNRPSNRPSKPHKRSYPHKRPSQLCHLRNFV